MEKHESYTRLLGLALRGGNLVMGSDAVQGAAHARTARLILLSADASVRTCKDAALWAERGNCLLVALPCDKTELGAALGRGSAAVVALTDTGLAAAVGERLARYDAERYGAVAERLRLKSKRAGERARARPDAARRKRGEAPRKTASARPNGETTRKSGAVRNGDARRKQSAARDGEAPRKITSARFNGGARRKQSAARDGESPRKITAARSNGGAPRKPGATRNGDAPRKSSAIRPHGKTFKKSAAPQRRDAETRPRRKKSD